MVVVICWLLLQDSYFSVVIVAAVSVTTTSGGGFMCVSAGGQNFPRKGAVQDVSPWDKNAMGQRGYGQMRVIWSDTTCVFV